MNTNIIRELDSIDLVGLLINKKNTLVFFTIIQQIHTDMHSMTLVCRSNVNNETIIKVTLPDELYVWYIFDPRDKKTKFIDEFVYAYNFVEDEKNKKRPFLNNLSIYD